MKTDSHVCAHITAPSGSVYKPRRAFMAAAERDEVPPCLAEEKRGDLHQSCSVV